MKILVGICGIGRGHSSRQYKIINELLKKGHEVRILTYGDGLDFFEKTDITTYNIFVPMVTFTNNKIDFISFIKRNKRKLITGFVLNRKVFNKLIKDNFIPDVCISDYEPVVAKFSYKLNIPLINIDQQSKFIYMPEDEIDGYSISEEKQRMKLFFPKFDKKLIISFYKIDSNCLPSNVKILSPFIRDEIKQNNHFRKKNKVVVYFSKFIDITIKQDLTEVLKIFSAFKNYDFVVYIVNELNYKINYSNVKLKVNNRESFARDLGEACCTISTAGHTLISEAIYCNIPMFVIPLPTYDQHYCAKFVNKNRIGYASDIITHDNLKKFINNIDTYVENIHNCKEIMKDGNSLKHIIEEIEVYENNN